MKTNLSKYSKTFFNRTLFKTVLSFILGSVIMFSVFAILIYNNTLESAKSSVESENEKSYQQITEILESNTRICMFFATYKDISPVFQSQSEFDLRQATLREEVETFISCFDYIASIELDTGDYVINLGSLPKGEMNHLQKYRSFHINYSNASEWPYILQIQHLDEDYDEFNVTINIYAQFISNQYISDNTYLLAPDGTILVAKDTSLLWKNISDVMNIDMESVRNDKSDKNYINVQSFIGDDGAVVLTLKDRKEIHSDAFSQIALLLVVGVFIATVGMVLIYTLLKKIYGPIEKVANTLKYYMPENESLAEKDVQLIEKFSGQENTDQNVRAAVLQIRKSQLQTLHSQISPHLLGNSLEVIKWEIIKRLGYNNPIEESLSTLSLFLSEAYQYKQMITTLSDEIDRTNLYIKMMRFCFYDRLTVNWNVDESLLNCSIISLTLQPLIENSIIHGFNDENENPEININILSENEKIIITVKDNGYGMEKGILNDILKSLYDDDSVSKHHIGLKNTHLKLRFLYGSEYGITNISSDSSGTKIELCLPKYDM